MNLFKGIHPQAAALLKEKSIKPSGVRVLRRARPARQIQMAKLMVNMNNYTKVFAKVLLLGSPIDRLVKGKAEKGETGIPASEVTRIENEMETLERDFEAIQGQYGQNMLELTMMRGYVRSLLQNEKISRFLSARYADLFLEIRAIAVEECC